MACQYKLEAGPGQELEVRLRLTRDGAAATMDLGKGHEAAFAARIKEADEFYRLCDPRAQPTRKRRSCARRSRA